MRVDEQAVVGHAFDTARLGLSQAQGRLDQAAQHSAQLDQADDGGEGSGGQPQRTGYMVADIVELSRARIEVQINAASIKSTSDATSMLTNVGRRIDMKV